MADQPEIVACDVTLYSEQEATLRVYAPRGSSDAVLTELALRELDASGGAEWVSTGWLHPGEGLGPRG